MSGRADPALVTVPEPVPEVVRVGQYLERLEVVAVEVSAELIA